MEFDSSLPAPQSIEQIRAKLQHLTTSLQALHGRLSQAPANGSDLPPWPIIASALNVTLSQLSTLTTTLVRAEDEARTVVVFPNDKFPTSAGEGLLATLMRTKPLPDAETWIDETRDHGEGLVPIKSFKWPVKMVDASQDAVMQEDDDDDIGEEYTLTEWLQIQRDRRNWTGFYTKREVDDAFEIDKDDLDDIRRARREESEKAVLDLKAMLRFARSGR